MDEMTPTLRFKRPDRLYRAVGFTEALNIVSPTSFDDEPTIPYGLCQTDGLESTEDLVVEQEVVTGQDKLPTWMSKLLDHLGG